MRWTIGKKIYKRLKGFLCHTCQRSMIFFYWRFFNKFKIHNLSFMVLIICGLMIYVLRYSWSVNLFFSLIIFILYILSNIWVKIISSLFFCIWILLILFIFFILLHLFFIIFILISVKHIIKSGNFFILISLKLSIGMLLGKRIDFLVSNFISILNVVNKLLWHCFISF